MHLTQALNRGVQLKADRTALICAGERRTWREFRERVARFASSLVALGLKPNERVAILADNGSPYFEYHYGVAWAGGVIVPLNTRLSDQELANILNDSGARMLLLGNEYAARQGALRSGVPALNTVITIGTRAA